MTYDLVIKDGTLIDGSGLPRYRADVGVKNGRIVSIGRIRAGAREMIDAEGRVVAPASSMATFTWTRRCSGTRSAPAPAGTA